MRCRTKRRMKSALADGDRHIRRGRTGIGDAETALRAAPRRAASPAPCPLIIATVRMTAMVLTTRINHFFQHRSERERFMFEKVRQTLSLPTILRRRAAARELGADSPFAIDREVGFRIFPPGTFPEADEIVTLTRGMEDHVDLNRPGLSKKARSGFMVPLLDPASLTLQSP